MTFILFLIADYCLEFTFKYSLIFDTESYYVAPPSLEFTM